MSIPKIILLSPLLASALFAIDYTNKLPLSIILNSGENRNDIAVLYEGNYYYSFGNTSGTSSGSDFAISTNGNRGFYTLTARNPTNGTLSGNKDFSNFYIGIANITNTDATFRNFDEFTFTKQTTLNNASLNLELGDKRDKIIGLNNGDAKLILNNSTFKSNAKEFQIAVKGASLKATNSNIDLQNAVAINSGTINIIGGSATFGEVKNAGLNPDPTGYVAGVASFINDGGIVTINKNFNNGSLMSGLESNCAIGGTCGGGIFQNINGATTKINGDFISREIGNQKSNIEIEGGKVEVAGKVENKAGSTIIFTPHNGSLGVLKASNFENTNMDSDAITINLSGISDGNIIAVIQSANITGLEKDNIQFIDYAGTLTPDELFDKVRDQTNTTPTTPPNNQGATISSKSTYNLIDKAFVDFLNARFGSNINGSLFNNSGFSAKDSDNIISNSQKTLRANYTNEPMIIIDALKTSNHLSPSKLSRGFTLDAIGIGFSGDNGILGGATISYHDMTIDMAYKAFVSYGYANKMQNSALYDSDMNANLFQIGFYSRLFFDKIELDIAVFGTNGRFKGSEQIKFKNYDILQSSSSFSIYSGDLDVSIGRRFGFGIFSLKPFLGFDNNLTHRSAINQNGDLGVSGKSIDFYTMAFKGGIEAKLDFDSGDIWGEASYKKVAINTKDDINLDFGDIPIAINYRFDNIISLNLGARFYFGGFKFELEGFYKNIKYDMNYFGGSASIGYLF